MILLEGYLTVQPNAPPQGGSFRAFVVAAIRRADLRVRRAGRLRIIRALQYE